MRLEALKSKINEVVMLDLVSGNSMTGKITAVADDGYVTINKPIVFNAVQNPHKINDMQVIPIPYGFPLAPIKDNVTISANHIITDLPVTAEMKQAYIKNTTGIMPVAANAMDDLPILGKK